MNGAMDGFMNIVGASLRNAVRRRWKFALVVFLLGAAVVALSHASDVGATMERMQAVAEAMESEGAEPSGEQIEAITRGAAMLFLVGALNLGFGFGTVLFAFLMPGGIVAHERRSGAIMLWAQHPMPLRSFYLQRYVGIQVATFAALATFGLMGAVAALPPTAAPPRHWRSGEICLIAGSHARSASPSPPRIRRAALSGCCTIFSRGLWGRCSQTPPWRPLKQWSRPGLYCGSSSFLLESWTISSPGSGPARPGTGERRDWPSITSSCGPASRGSASTGSRGGR